MSNKLPQGWKKLSIDDVLIDKISGEWGKECENENEGVYVLRTTNFTNEGKLKLDEVVKRNIEEKKVDKKKLQYGDIILEKSGGSENQPVGRVVYFNIESEDIYLCNNFTQILRANPEIINSKYLLYVLFDLHRKGITEYFQNKTTGIRNLQTKSYLEQKINVPPLEEQERIVSILERAEDAICKREESNRLLDEYLKSVFVEMFGIPLLNTKRWSEELASEICTKITDGSHFSPKDCQNSNIPMLSVKDMMNNGFSYENCKHVSEGDYTELVKNGCKPLLGDVLIAKDGSYFYYGFVLKEEIDQALLSSIAILRPNTNVVNPYYLRYYMMSKEVVKLVGKKYVSGAALKRVILKGIRQIPVMIPPIEMQNKFENIVKQVDEMNLKSNGSLKEMQNNFNSLMQRAFNGEL